MGFYVNLCHESLSGKVETKVNHWEKIDRSTSHISCGWHYGKGISRRVLVIRVETGKEREFKSRMDDLVVPGDVIKVPGRYF